MCVHYIYMHLPTLPHRQEVTESFLKWRLGFRVFLLLDGLPNKGWKNQSDLPFTLTGERIRGFIPFPRI